MITNELQEEDEEERFYPVDYFTSFTEEMARNVGMNVQSESSVAHAREEVN